MCYNFEGLPSFTWHNVLRFIHIVACISGSFSLLNSIILLYSYTMLYIPISQLMDIKIAPGFLVTTMNNTAVSIHEASLCVGICFHVLIS